MAIEETFRHEFQMRVEEAIDAESARFLMAHLPPVPWPDVATKHDLEVMQMATKSDLAVIDGQFKTMQEHVDGRFKVMQTAIDGRFEAMQEHVDGRFKVMQTAIDGRFDLVQKQVETAVATVRADLMELMTNQTRTMIFALIGAIVSMAALSLFR